jgi:tetratricopeptide (TPR) repeat protein
MLLLALATALRRGHLLEERTRGRYEFHDLLRAYARERVEEEEASDGRRAAAHRLLGWYLHSADAADRELIPYHRHVPLDTPRPSVRPPALASYDEAMNWCETERGNLVVATAHAAEVGEHVIAWKLPLALWSFFTLRRFWADWFTTHEIGLASAQELQDRYAEAWIVNNLGIAYRQLGHHQQALDHYHLALAIWQEIGDQWGQARALNEFGETYQEMRQPEEALEYYKQALALWQEIQDPWGEASTLTGLGNVYRELRRFDDAVDYAHWAIQVWRSSR